MPGNCAIFRSWDTGNLLTASDLTMSFTQVGVTNMTPTCLDDYAVDSIQFRLNVDPYPGSVASLPTSLAGELERIRFIIKTMTGWSQWYAHTESVGSSAFVKKIGDTMTGALLFSPDNTVDIGAAGATRPRTLYAGTSMVLGDNAAAAGRVRMPNAQNVAWRNAANVADLTLGVSSGDVFEFTGGNVRFVAGELTFLSASVLGPSIHFETASLLFRGGTSGHQWNNQANTLERLRLTDAGLLSQIAGQSYTATYTPHAQLGTTAVQTNSNVQFVGNRSTDGVCSSLEFINHQVGLLAEPRLALIQVERAGANNTGLVGFYTTAAGSISEKMRITSGGRILFNTTVEAGADTKSIVMGRAADGLSFRAINNANTSAIRVLDLDTADRLHIGVEVASIRLGSQVEPESDNATDIGTSSLRFRSGIFGTSVQVGTNPAATGAVRIANATYAFGRNAANGADVRIAGINASDQLVLGSNGTDLVPDTTATSGLGTSSLKWEDLFLSSSVQVGTNPAAAGAVRLANAVNISGRNAANGADVIIAQVDASDRVRIGPQSTGNIRMSGQTRCDIDTGDRLVLPVGTDKWAV